MGAKRKQSPAPKKDAKNPMKKGRLRLQYRDDRSWRAKTYKKPAYIPKEQQVEETRQADRTAVSVPIKDLYQCTYRELLGKLHASGHLPKIRSCHLCAGKVSKLKEKVKGSKRWFYRCQSRSCHTWVHPTAKSPVFYAASGDKETSIADQAVVMHMVLCDEVSLTACHRATGIDHKVIEKLVGKCRGIITQHVAELEAAMKVGGQGKLVEQDEVAVRKTDSAKKQGRQQVKWNIWVGAKERGNRKSLVLQKRADDKCIVTRQKLTKTQLKRGVLKGRASPPGYTKDEYAKFKETFLAAGSWHMTDGAKAYKSVLAEKSELHDAVSHDPSRKGGAQYTKVVKRRVAGETSEQLAGTQSLDGLWKHVKKALESVQASDPQGVRTHVKLFQWHHWHRMDDRWAILGQILKLYGD